MKIADLTFKLNTAILPKKSLENAYGYTGDAIYKDKIWDNFLVSNREVRNVFMVSAVEAFNQRLCEYFAKKKN